MITKPSSFPGSLTAATEREFSEEKHKRDATGKFTSKNGSRESGSSFQARANARAAEKKAEEDAKKREKEEAKAKREREAAAKKAEREKIAAAKKAEREREKAKREAEREQKRREAATRKGIQSPSGIGNQKWGEATGRYSGATSSLKTSPGIEGQLDAASKNIKITGATDVSTAIKNAAGDPAATAKLPLTGIEREEILQKIRDNYSPVRQKISSDGSGWWLDDRGVLWKI